MAHCTSKLLLPVPLPLTPAVTVTARPRSVIDPEFGGWKLMECTTTPLISLLLENMFWKTRSSPAWGAPVGDQLLAALHARGVPEFPVHWRVVASAWPGAKV